MKLTTFVSRPTITSFLFASLAISASCIVNAHSFKIAQLDIAHPYSVATVTGQKVGGVFFKHIENKGDAADRMVSASVSPDIAARTELHTMNTENDVMRMRQIPAIDIPAKTTVPMVRGLKKDGYHVMLMDLKAPLKEGDKIPLKLTFEKAGTVEVMVNVESLRHSNGSLNAHHAAGH